MKGWYRGKPVPQADGDDGEAEPPKTRREPYPQLSSIDQDEAIYHLKHTVARLERDLEALHLLLSEKPT